MRLTEQFRNRLQKLAGLDSKTDNASSRPKPFSTGSMSYSCSPCVGCQPASNGPFNSLEECENTCFETNIDTFFDGCPGSSQCGGFNSKEEFCNRCELEYESTQMWAQQNSLPNCDCCNPQIEGEGCTDSTADNYDPEATVDDGSCLIEMFMCINCEVVSLGMVPLYEDAMEWTTYNPDAFGGTGAYSLGYVYFNQNIENDYFSLNGDEIYNGNMETCGVNSLFPVTSYPQATYQSCPNNPYAD